RRRRWIEQAAGTVAATAGRARTATGGATARQRGARGARRAGEEADAESRRAAARRKGLVISSLALVAQLAIAVHAPEAAAACDVGEITLADDAYENAQPAITH